MFTGIVEEVGRIAGVDALGGGRRLRIAASFASALTPDESVAINGACMTVVGTDAGTFEVVVVEESLRKTTLGGLVVGQSVNLERALRAGGRLDGHFVQGHVDTTGRVVSVETEATDRLYTIQFDPVFSPYVIPVGSIAIDGISLTVARLAASSVTVAIIPHTYDHTIVPTWVSGAAVNLEFDMIGKYIARYLAHHAATWPANFDPQIE